MTVSRWILLEMRSISVKVVEKIKTHILCSIKFSRKSCKLWDNVENYGRAREAIDDNIIRRMRISCSITKATDTHKHSQYVILIAFPQQQLFRKRASLLRYTYIFCLCFSPNIFLSCSSASHLVTLTHSLSLSHKHTHTHSHNHAAILCLLLTVTINHVKAVTRSLPFCLPLTLSVTLSHERYLTQSVIHSAQSLSELLPVICISRSGSRVFACSVLWRVLAPLGHTTRAVLTKRNHYTYFSVISVV